MSRISKRKRIYMCMASVMCMLLLLIPLPVSANDQGSILLKATVEDEAAVYNLSNTEFTMYQVGIYKKNSWVLETEFAKSGVVFDFEDSSAQAEAAKKLGKYVQRNIWKDQFRWRSYVQRSGKRSVSFCPDTKNTNWQSSISK